MLSTSLKIALPKFLRDIFELSLLLVIVLGFVGHLQYAVPKTTEGAPEDSSTERSVVQGILAHRFALQGTVYLASEEGQIGQQQEQEGKQKVEQEGKQEGKKQLEFCEEGTRTGEKEG